MKRSLLNSLIMMILFAHVVIGHSGIRDYVLCIGKDGHVALEYSVALPQSFDCDAFTFTTPSSLSLLIGDVKDTHCEDCYDVSLASECTGIAKVQSRESFPHMVILSGVLELSPPSLSDQNYLVEFYLYSPDNIYQPFRSLRTTVLLI